MRHSKLTHVMIVSVLLAAATAFIPAETLSAQVVDSEKVDAENAWRILVDSAQKRLGVASVAPSTVREIIDEIDDFAQRFPRTELAAFALFKAAALAASVGDSDLAEEELEEALIWTQDPKLMVSIEQELERLSVRVGKPAPALAIEDWVRGNPTTLDELKGKVVLVDMFQIICPGCRRAHPEIVRMQERYKDDGFEVLGLAVAFELHSAQTPLKIRQYVDEKAFPYPVALDKDLIETFQLYGARGTPFTVLIDREGRIRYLDFFRLEAVESTIRQLLNEG